MSEVPLWRLRTLLVHSRNFLVRCVDRGFKAVSGPFCFKLPAFLKMTNTDHFDAFYMQGQAAGLIVQA